MLVKDLIKLLEELLEKHKPSQEVMGDCEIMIDVFTYAGYQEFEYAGISKDIIITYTEDSVYPVLTAKESTWR